MILFAEAVGLFFTASKSCIFILFVFCVTFNTRSKLSLFTLLTTCRANGESLFVIREPKSKMVLVVLLTTYDFRRFLAVGLTL